MQKDEKQFTSKEGRRDLASARLKALLVITPLITGAAVMMIEILGTRIISPYFGASLYVWTSLITVTLIALAVGYWWGGYIADKKRSASFLYFLIFLAGIFLLFIPSLKKSFLNLSLNLGLRMGSLAGSFLLFFLPLFLLGAVTPYLVKLYASDLSSIGKVVGYLYAISTTGSFVGTILTGFLFIPHFKNESILFFVSIALLVLSLVYWLFFQKKRSAFTWLLVAVAILLPALLVLEHLSVPEADLIMDDAHFHITAEENSAYGQIKVVDVNDRMRTLVLDGLTQNLVDLTTGFSACGFTYALPLIARSYHPNGRTALAIGLGAGIVPSELRREGLAVDCVEINPVIVRVSEKYFGFKPDRVSEKFSDFQSDGASEKSSGFKPDDGLNVFIQDARYFVRNCHKKYDLVFLDAFNGDSVPEHLLTLEMFLAVKKLMNPGGALCINYFGCLVAHGRTFGINSLTKTLKQVFAQVVAFTDLPAGGMEGNRVDNIYFLAMDEQRDPGRLIDVDRSRCSPSIYDNLCELWDHKIDLNKDMDSGIVLTDAYNPISFYDASNREDVRKGMQSLLGKVLL